MESIKRDLFGPGPTNVPDSILQALSLPTIGHLDPAFLGIMDEVGERLRHCFHTHNSLTFVLSAPGSIRHETCIFYLPDPVVRSYHCMTGAYGGMNQHTRAR